MGQAPIPQGVTAICAHEGSAWTAGAFSEPDTLLQWTPAGKVAGRTEVASEGAPFADFTLLLMLNNDRGG